MIKKDFEKQRLVKTQKIESDLVVIGGGMSGVCCAITAARAGISVTLVHDRPVLGGNASSEVRLWILGATSHMGNNNRWAREGGITDEILVENLYRNKEGNPIILDTILLEKITEEPNINLLLNTSVYEVEKSSDTEIKSVTGFCSQNSTKYIFEAPLFCDSSGDGIVAFQAGAPFRMGAEHPEEFDEGFAPLVEDYGELLGHSIYFYTKDVGDPVRFVAPGFALKKVDELPRIRNYQLQEHGCKLWWVEYGGRLDTIHQSEEIKWELWKFIYGLWDYVKNSGKYPEAETLTLEWVGTIPGKRESRRFEGDYMLNQKDIVEQRSHYDAVAFGGWSLDLHPADGIYSDKPGCNQWHSKGIYQIPYRCYYSRSLDNLFLAGRIISASHVAFGSSRVMATCSHGAQAVGLAAALATEKNLKPRDLADENHIKVLQQELNKRGQSIPGIPIEDENNLANEADITASSELELSEIPPDGPWKKLTYSTAQLLPLKKGVRYHMTFQIKADCLTSLDIELRTSYKPCNYTPDVTLEEKQIILEKGEQKIRLSFNATLETDQYAFVCMMRNDKVSVKTSHLLVSGLVSVVNGENKSVSNFGRQDPPSDLGVEAFEFWCPERRPEGKNLAFRIQPALDAFKADNLSNGYTRPTNTTNSWVAGLNHQSPEVTLKWPGNKTIRSITLMFDTDYDHAMESSLMGHPEHIMPFCIRNYSIMDGDGNLLYKMENNHQSINIIELDNPIESDQLVIKVEKPQSNVPAGLFEIICR